MQLMTRKELLNLPNALTISRICLTPLFLALLSADDWYLKSMAVVVFAIASLTDLYDGRIARTSNSTTEFGRFMDPLADKILVTSALVALALARIVHYWIIVPIIVRDVLITAMRLRGAYHGRQMETSRLAKWKTTVQLLSIVIILLLIGLQEIAERFNWAGPLPLDASSISLLTNGLMAAVLFLTLLSGLHYFLRSGFPYNESQ
jgi:CDP-diacylglycerol--glycerol-3-phosphate 3-phosphatidyltransferase